MLRQIVIQNGPYNFIDEMDVPDTCPRCGKAIDAQFICSSYSLGLHTDSPNTTVTFQCPSCDRFFHIDKNKDGNLQVYPQIPIFDLDKSIATSYPQFAKIYLQSLQAQAEGLNHICGMGYRKSVEELVKSYLIEQYPEKRPQILKEPLSQSIARIESSPIQSLAKASAWLGNDHVHMVNKHPDHDIESMKRFIKVLAAIIIQDHTVAEAMDFISHR